MKNQIHHFDEDSEIIVERYSIREGIKLAIETIESIEYCIDAGYKFIDSSVYIEYKDGSYYNNCQGDISGAFRKSGIKAIIIDCEGCCYQIAGKYMMDENHIPQVI